MLLLPSVAAQADLICGYEVPQPYLGPLLIDSKYDQSDDSKSTLDSSLDVESDAIKSDIYAFIKLIPKIVDQAHNSEAEKQVYLADCLSLILDEWALPGAILSAEATGTGKAVRKWSLATISMALYKRSILHPEYQLTEAQSNWIGALSNQVKLDYAQSPNEPFDKFNNHDYWAAWSVTVSGMLLGRDDNFDWSYQLLDKAFEQIRRHSSRHLALLPNEVERGSLGLDYSNFALAPIVMLSVYAEKNGFPLLSENLSALDKLVTFTSMVTSDASAGSQYFDVEQTPVPAYKTTWVIPFLHFSPNHHGARKLYYQNLIVFGNYSMLGGELSDLFDLSGLEKRARPPNTINLSVVKR
ncbi:MAG: alginate lyase family protein [Ketobacteraceae bacterium]|nr:alginate lyase family protein [Ketobacteraceae bacterium]